MMHGYDVDSRNSEISLYLSEVCITATAFVKPDNNFFGIHLRLVSIFGDGHFFLQKSCSL